MSKDIIYREDAIKALRKLGHEVVVIDKVCSLGVAQEFIDAIRALPSADRPQKKLAEALAPYTTREELIIADAESKGYAEGFKDGLEADRPQGEWIDDGFSHKCSVCGKQGVGIEYYKFCPNCGAKMKGAQ